LISFSEKPNLIIFSIKLKKLILGKGNTDTPESLDKITFLGSASAMSIFNSFSLVPLILCFSPSTCVSGILAALEIKK
jgi:hypothetical protein